MRPSVSNAAIKESLWVTGANGMVAVEFAGYQIYRVKLVSLNQLSSMFIIRFPSLSRSSIFYAYCCLSTWHRWLLALGGIFFTIRYLRPKSSFMILFTFSTDTSILSKVLTRFTIVSALIIGISWSYMSLTFCLIASTAYRSFASFFLRSAFLVDSSWASLTNLLTRAVDILYSLAISFW